MAVFKTRLISGAALLVLAFLTIRAGGYVLLGTMLFLSVVGVFELYRALGERFPVNITASGGVSSLEDIKALQALNIYAAIIGKAYYTGQIDLKAAQEVCS